MGSEESEKGIISWVQKFGLVSLMGITGLSICGYGIWQVVKPTEPLVEIVKNQSSEHSSASLPAGRQGSELNQIVVDVAGAVEKPGVYRLASGSRIGDALVAAGGLSASADREWVAQTINLAESIKDGGKLYIPANQQISESNNQNTQSTGGSEKSESQKDGKININSANQSQLESLWGIGEARAKAIIAARPYGSTGEIVEKAKIPESVYEKIKDQIRVY